MKKICTFLIIVVLGFTAANAQTSTNLKPIGEIIAMKETVHDFGKIQQGRPVTYEFEIVNNGADTLRLENVQASCGCTTPVWKKDPVIPGSAAKILVGYNAAAEGYFEKLVTIYYNGNQTKVITIKGTVFKTPATSAPENASVKLLKQIN